MSVVWRVCGRSVQSEPFFSLVAETGPRPQMLAQDRFGCRHAWKRSEQWDTGGSRPSPLPPHLPLGCLHSRPHGQRHSKCLRTELVLLEVVGGGELNELWTQNPQSVLASVIFIYY